MNNLDTISDKKISIFNDVFSILKDNKGMFEKLGDDRAIILNLDFEDICCPSQIETIENIMKDYYDIIKTMDGFKKLFDKDSFPGTRKEFKSFKGIDSQKTIIEDAKSEIASVLRSASEDIGKSKEWLLAKDKIYEGVSPYGKDSTKKIINNLARGGSLEFHNMIKDLDDNGVSAFVTLLNIENNDELLFTILYILNSCISGVGKELSSVFNREGISILSSNSLKQLKSLFGKIARHPNTNTVYKNLDEDGKATFLRIGQKIGTSGLDRQSIVLAGLNSDGIKVITALLNGANEDLIEKFSEIFTIASVKQMENLSIVLNGNSSEVLKKSFGTSTVKGILR